MSVDLIYRLSKVFTVQIYFEYRRPTVEVDLKSPVQLSSRVLHLSKIGMEKRTLT